MITIEEYISSCKKVLEPYIDEYLTELIKKRAYCGLAELYETFRDAGRGGKCIRGSLVKLGYEIALGRPAGEEILSACAAFEIFQTAILGHDDIIDKSPLRRGKNSIWRALGVGLERRQAAQSNCGAENRSSDVFHYGISQAICLGDIGIILANRLITESAFEADKKIEACNTFLDVQLKTVDGEMLDVLMSYEKNYSEEENIYRVSILKTAWYTIAGPLLLGATFGGASAGLLDAMRRYGLSLGIAFQLRDDILGINATEAEIGKSNISDISEGKVTLLAYYAIKRATPVQLEKLRQIYGNETVSESDRIAVLDIFKSTGAFDEVAEKIESYLTEAAGIVKEITQNSEQSSLLTQLGNMMTQRKS